MTSHLAPTHIVGIGASTEGLTELEAFFKAMPADSGMAFVLVLDLVPDVTRLAGELLAQCTKMPIRRVENGMELSANTIYLIPSRQVVTVTEGHLHFQERSGTALFQRLDFFFESLASAAQSRAICIILAGTGSDSTRGIRAIHEAGGLVLVQSMESAQFDGMLRAAINTGLCDYVTNPAEMPALLLEYAANPDVMRVAEAELNIEWEEGEHAEIFAYLRRSYGLDFSKYKPSTVGRRIARRLAFHRLERISEYVDLLEEDSQELDSLYHELLIGVTEFLRDPAVFAYLEREVVPTLFEEATSEGLRIWVAACATGEEAYSLAILLHEHAEKIQYAGKISIFATDVHRKSLNVASQGVYDEGRLQNLSAERLARYFTPVGMGKHKVVSELRKMVIFAPHNLLSDPPFTKIDLVCCRNLLIYFQPETQDRTIAALNFALRMGGTLLLGISEGVGKFADDFATINSTYKLFRKAGEVRLNLAMDETRGSAMLPTTIVPLRSHRNSVTIDRQTLHDYDQVINRLLHAGVLINEQRQVLHYFGAIGQYLKPLTGPATTDFTQMVNDDLHVALTVALQRAATLKGCFSLPGVAVKQGDSAHRVDLRVDCIPYDKASALHFLVTLTPVNLSEPLPSLTVSTELVAGLETSQTLQAHISDLELDLQSARENLQATVEELQTSNEELKATNEELLASNEELQSTNEELYSVNAEYEKKNLELQVLNEDHDRLLESLEVGVVFLDDQLVIRKFNAASALAFKLMPQDVGRPIDHIAYQLADRADGTLFTHLSEVLATGESMEREVRTQDGKWLLKRIFPYFDTRNEVKGVILTFTDVTRLKADEARLRTLFELLPVGVAILNKAGQVVNANPKVADITALSQEALARGDHAERRYVHPDGSDMRQSEFASARVTTEGKPVYDVETGIVKEDGSLTWTSVSAAPLPDGGVVVVTADITTRKQAERELRRWADIFQNVAFGFVVGSPEDKNLGIMNPAFARMHGYTMEELIGAPIASVFAPESRPELPEHIRLIHETGHHAWEAKHLHKDGTVFPVLVDAVAVKDETGTIRYRVVSVQDISKHKQTDAIRARLAERLKLATHSAQIGIWDWDIQRDELVWDDQMYALYGLQPGEFGGAYEAWLNGVHPDDREHSSKETTRAVDGEAAYDTEFRVLWPDGSVHWLKADGDVFRDQHGKPTRMVGVNYDITERRQAEENLRASEAKFRAVFDNAPVGISLIDAERNVLESNDMLAQVVRMDKARLAAGGYRRLRYIRQDGSEFLTSELASSRAIAERRAISNVVNGIVLEDGEVIWTQVSAAPLGAGDLRFVVITQDITERKRVEDELRRSNAELEQFAYIASHDLQEPLRTVAGMVQLLQQRYEGQLDERADEYIHFAVDASNRMQQLINDLLDFSRVDRKERSFAVTDMAQVLQKAQANLQSAITESGAQITADPLPTVQADGEQLTQVLQNLVGNAIKFRGEQPLAIHISAEKIENGWQFAVRDNGIGIDPHYFERVFLIFQRLHTRRKYPGTGIGLAICKKIVERHGGKIWVESELNHGATFFFTLPERSTA